MARRKKEKSPTDALIDQLLEGEAAGTLFDRGGLIEQGVVPLSVEKRRLG